MEYKIGQTFSNTTEEQQQEYSKIAEWCNANNCMITELTPEGNDRIFRIDAIPAPTKEQLAQIEINKLKRQLVDMDYKGQKYLDGEYTEEEWQKIVEERRAIREKIRELGG